MVKRLLLTAIVAFALFLPTTSMHARADTAEITFWESVRDSKNSFELEAYLTTYPNGKFAPLAKLRIKQLKSGAQVSNTPGQDAPAKGSETTIASAPPSPQWERRKIKVKLGDFPSLPTLTMLGVRLVFLGRRQIVDYSLGGVARGIIIQHVLPDGPAQTAGLTAGDVIDALDGKQVHDYSGLKRLIGAQQPGRVVTVTFWRPAGGFEAFLENVRTRSEHGDAKALFALGMIKMHGIGLDRRYSEALDLYRKAAKAGYAHAATLLAREGNDSTEVSRWYRKAAEMKDPDGMTKLATALANGEGVEKDLAMSIYWYRQAAAKGNPEAMFELGKRYFEGKGVAKNAIAAMNWFRKSARRGETEAMYRLATGYRTGIGIKQDVDYAVRWYSEASRSGFEKADEALRFMGKTRVSDPPPDLEPAKSRPAVETSATAPTYQRDEPADLGDLNNLGKLE